MGLLLLALLIVLLAFVLGFAVKGIFFLLLIVALVVLIFYAVSGRGSSV